MRIDGTIKRKRGPIIINEAKELLELGPYFEILYISLKQDQVKSKSAQVS